EDIYNERVSETWRMLDARLLDRMKDDGDALASTATSASATTVEPEGGRWYDSGEALFRLASRTGTCAALDRLVREAFSRQERTKRSGAVSCDGWR
ncbi:MAG TPA: hypothetical protein VII82_02535, partial [Polyangiaceae bacterium]